MIRAHSAASLAWNFNPRVSSIPLFFALFFRLNLLLLSRRLGRKLKDTQAQQQPSWPELAGILSSHYEQHPVRRDLFICDAINNPEL